MARGKAFCAFNWCPEPDHVIWEHEKAAWAVTGYEREREGGGANQIAGRKRTGDAFHDRHDEDCFTRHLRGYDQPTLS